MQVVTYLHTRFSTIWFRRALVARNSELEFAFDAAIAQARKCVKAKMVAVGGESAGPYLQKLEQELTRERARALEHGTVDKEWFQKTVRWLVEWVPETELALIAVLGRIARATPTALS
jgi:hypothetical protein